MHRWWETILIGSLRLGKNLGKFRVLSVLSLAIGILLGMDWTFWLPRSCEGVCFRLSRYGIIFDIELYLVTIARTTLKTSSGVVLKCSWQNVQWVTVPYIGYDPFGLGQQVVP